MIFQEWRLNRAFAPPMPVEDDVTSDDLELEDDDDEGEKPKQNARSKQHMSTWLKDLTKLLKKGNLMDAVEKVFLDEPIVPYLAWTKLSCRRSYLCLSLVARLGNHS